MERILNMDKSTRTFIEMWCLALTLLLFGVWFDIGYCAVVDGDRVGVVPNKDFLLNAVDTVSRESNVTMETNLYAQLVLKNDFTSFDQMLDEIRKKAGVLVPGVALYVDGRRILAMQSEIELTALLDEHKTKFAEDAQLVNIVNELEYRAEYVPASIMVDNTGGLNLLSHSEEQLAQVGVTEDCTLEDFATYYKTTPQRLSELNTELGPILVKDSNITVPVDVPLLKVVTTHRAIITENVDFPVVETTTNDLYEGEEVVATSGKIGEKLVEVDITKINGEELERTVISDQVVTEPEERRILLGSRKKEGFMRPVNTVVTSPFGARWGRTHKGIDFAGNIGTPIYASASGKVSFAGVQDGFGNLIIINHGKGFETYYAHQSKFAVSVGEEVKMGQLIGYVGNTGLSTGPHLHFEIRSNGVAIDPSKHFN